MTKKPGRPIGGGGKARELTSDEVQAVTAILKAGRNGPRNVALFIVGIGSGLRVGELASLSLTDVAPHGEVLASIRLDKSRCKSGKSREVFLTTAAQQALRDYLPTLRWKDTALFRSQKRGHMTTQAIQGLLFKAFKEAKITGASSHSLRRTHANILRRAGVDLAVIQKQLGHSSLQITQEYFTVTREDMSVIGAI